MAKKKARVIAYESGNPRTKGQMMVGPYGSMGKRFTGFDDVPPSAISVTISDVDPVTHAGVPGTIRSVSRRELMESYEFG